MGTLIVRAIVILALPLIVFLGGASLMQRLSGHKQVTDQLQKLPEEDRTGLGLRKTGYTLAAVKTFWGALNKEGLASESRNLELDLLFPFLYGSAFAGSLLCAWAASNRPFHPAWILTPLFIEIVADWIENFVQLGQLKLLKAGSLSDLQPGWIQIASVATVVKYWLFIVSYILVAGMVGWMIFRNWPRSPAR